MMYFIIIALMLFSSLGFAEDIVPTIIFKDILGYQEYPGGPFTGNIVQDLLFLIIMPIVLILIFIKKFLDIVPLIKKALHQFIIGSILFIYIIFGGFFPIVGSFSKSAFPILIIGVVVYAVWRKFWSGSGENDAEIRPYKKYSMRDLWKLRDKTDSKIKDYIKQIDGISPNVTDSDLNNKLVEEQQNLREIIKEINIKSFRSL